MRTLRNGLCIALLAASASVMANEQTEPIGSCTITIPNMTPACINFLTRKACQERAQNSGAAAQWVEDASCPTPEEIMKNRSDLYPQ